MLSPTGATPSGKARGGVVVALRGVAHERLPRSNHDEDSDYPITARRTYRALGAVGSIAVCGQHLEDATVPAHHRKT
jgi:hypothetical protein